MQRRFALVLGTIAFALVISRAVLRGELATEALPQAIIALMMFAAMGSGFGWIAEYLVRQDTETRYRAKVAWYRRQLENQSTEQL